MTAFIGTIGRLVQLPYVSASEVSLSDDYTFDKTLEGKVKAQAKAVKRRTWALSVTRYLSPDQGTLMAFVHGEWGRGPFVWVSPDAPVTNMLSPEQSTCDPSTLFTSGVTKAGPLDCGADGVAGRSFSNSSPASPFYFGGDKTPVIPGRPVTASAWLVGAGAQIRISWYDAAGAFIVSATGTGQGVAGTAKRVFHTATPPSNAASAVVAAVNATTAARPALTWTSELFPWSNGRGCLKAVVHSASTTVRAVSKVRNGIQASDIAFTVTEVG